MQEELRELILAYIDCYNAHERAIQEKLDWMVGIDSDGPDWTREWELRGRIVSNWQSRLEGKRKDIVLFALKHRGDEEISEINGEKIQEILKKYACP